MLFRFLEVVGRVVGVGGVWGWFLGIIGWVFFGSFWVWVLIMEEVGRIIYFVFNLWI